MFTGTKEIIFDAASELFAENGYENVSMREIAAKAGIRASSIYNHFRGKEDILDCVYEYFADYIKKNRPSAAEMGKLLIMDGPDAAAEKICPFYLHAKNPRIQRCAQIAYTRYFIDVQAEGIIKNQIYHAGIAQIADLLSGSGQNAADTAVLARRLVSERILSDIMS